MDAHIKIGGLQKLTLLDYPEKTACTVFLAGCNFRCPFCHNAPLVLLDKDLGEGRIDEEELFGYLKRRRGLLDGVCVTGGEPLLQQGIEPFLERMKNMGYLVKLDTNGSFPDKLSKLVRTGLVDYVAMDIKNSRKRYKQAIGAVQPVVGEIEKSIYFLLSDEVDYEFRTTVVKGIHQLEDLKEISRWISGAKRYYIQNFADSGSLVGAASRMEPFSKEELGLFLETVKKEVPNAMIRGTDVR